MTNRQLVDSAWEEARHATILLSTWEKKTYTAAQAAATRWGKCRALLNQVVNDKGGGTTWNPTGQTRLVVPIIDRYRRPQATRSLTPDFYMITDGTEGWYTFTVDGQPAGRFAEQNLGSDGTGLLGHVGFTLEPGLHVLQGVGERNGTVSVPITFLVDPVNGPPV